MWTPKFLKRRLKKIEERLRFQRNRIEENARNAIEYNSYITAHTHISLNRLKELSQSKTGIAFATPMPPEDTGLAIYAHRMALENPGNTDIFCSFRSLGAYFDTAASLSEAAEVFPLEMLAQACLVRKYHTIVFAIGNSNHNLKIAERLRTIRRTSTEAKIVAQVHDPVLFNLSRITFGPASEIDRAYAKAYPRLGNRRFSTMSDEDLLSEGITGFSALFGEQVDHVIVHSRSAMQILADDMREIDPVPTTPLYLPVLRALPAPRSIKLPEMRRPVIGSFGVPNASKHIDEVLVAGRSLLDKGIVGSVVIAGFCAGQVAESIELLGGDGFHLFDSPADDELEALMRKCDVAVQLRRSNLGESSGVISQLLEFETPIVTSRVGSFMEFEGLVTYCDDGASPESVEAAVVEAMNRDSNRSALIREYVDSHRTEDFLKELQHLNRVAKINSIYPNKNIVSDSISN